MAGIHLKRTNMKKTTELHTHTHTQKMLEKTDQDAIL